ncbi:MAG TPA: biotin/lipoyl-containing protein, partial [Pilimelia sp.]|nr:biotin/lipoyl-containing protein [Pilimelia sp.]
MPVSVTMPRLGESVTEGTVTRWLKQEGDHVEVDEPLLEVSTDKVDTEIPSPVAGVLTRIVVGEDETAEVGSELAVIDGDGAAGGGDAGGGQAQAQPEAAQEPEAGSAQPDAEPAQRTPEAAQPAEAQQPAPPAQPPASGDGSGGGQTTVVRMPALGESVTEGTVTRWLKQVGERVDAYEPLLEVSTDKVDTEIPSPAGGTLLEIKVAEDDTAPVGAELAVIGSTDGAAAPSPAQAPSGEAAAQPEAAPPAEPAAREEPAAEARPAA